MYTKPVGRKLFAILYNSEVLVPNLSRSAIFKAIVIPVLTKY